MPYYLKHHFDYERSLSPGAPKEVSASRVDHRELGYVQNVMANQVLAEFVEVTEEEAADCDMRFLLAKKELPVGANTAPNPDNPDQLVALKSGHVTYENGLIAVKRTVILGQDLDILTGNVNFVGDLVVQGDVKCGFSAKGRNIMVRGLIEASTLTAQGSIVSETGLKGGKQAVLTARKGIRLPFCENATLRAYENILIDSSCLHSQIYVSQKFAVKDKLVGGEVHCNNLVYVGKKLGGGANTKTAIYLGYDPFLIAKAEEIDEVIAATREELESHEGMMAKGGELAQEVAPMRAAAMKKLATYEEYKIKTWQRVNASDRLGDCQLMVPGEVGAGVEINIGPVVLKVRQHLENVRFFLEGDEIVHASPALKAHA